VPEVEAAGVNEPTGNVNLSVNCVASATVAKGGFATALFAVEIAALTIN
jgi:hypothetical protein